MNDMNTEIRVGDVLENSSRHALCRKVRVTEITATHFTAKVLEGDNLDEPLTVFRAGWPLYKKTKHQNN